MFPTLWTVVFLNYEEPVAMVMIGGVATAAILMIVVIAAINFRTKRSLPELEPGRLYDVAFWVSAISIIVLAGYGVWKAVGITC